MIDYLTKLISGYILKNETKHSSCNTKDRKDGISIDIETLRKLKDELVRRDEELKISKIEWDKTFDAIIDDIIIINTDGVITKANKSFLYHLESLGVSWKDVIGKKWSDIRLDMGINTTCIVDECLKTGHYQENIITIGNRTYSVLANPIFDSDGDISSVVRVSRDITKIEQQRLKIDRRGRIFEAISSMSKLLVNHENWEDAISEILKLLGESTKASRAYIFSNEVKEDRVCANLSNVWVSEIKTPCRMTECVSYELLPEWKKDLEIGNTIEGRFKDCDECKDKESCIHLNDTIVCAVPIFSNKKWWGFIGFDYDSKMKQWKEEDEAILRVAADIIGGVLYHRDRYYKCMNGDNNVD